jgi:hypothetical protein
MGDIVKLKNLLLLLFVIALQKSLFCQDSSFVPQFLLFTNYEETYTCAKNPLVSDINYFKNNFPNSKITVYVIINDENDFNPYVKKQFSVDDVKPDLNANIAKRYGLSKFPAMLMLNHHSDILHRNDNVTKEKKKSPKKIYSSYGLDFPEEIVAFETDAYNQIVTPKTDCILLNDSILTLLDMMKNTLSKYSVNDGKLISQNSPDDSIINYTLSKFTDDDQLRIKKSDLNISEYHSFVQNNNESLIIYNNILDAEKGSACSIARESIKAYYRENNNITIEDNTNTIESIQFPKVSLKGTFFSNILFSSKFVLNDKPDYSAFLISDKINFSNCKGILTVDEIIKYYEPYPKDSYINSFPCLDYIDNDSTFVYLDPWNSFFFTYHLNNGFQTKIEPYGLLRTIFSQTEKYGEGKRLGTYNDGFSYYLNNMIVLNENIYVLIIALDEKNHKNYFVIQKYDKFGEFIRENVISSESDIIKRVDFARSKDDKNLYLLLNTKEKRWRLYKIPTEEL